MNAASLAAAIEERLRAAGNKERRRRMEWYAPTKMEVLGVATPDLRVVVREAAGRLRREEAPRVVSVARALVARNVLEGRQAAYEILSRHRPALAALGTRDVEALGRGMDNWSSVDAFACLVSGPCWREKRVTDSAVRRWARSRDRWWRRAALVSTVPLNQKSRGGNGDVKRTLDLCQRLVADGDEMVVKALSWALRALAGRDREAVEDFLARNGDALHARVLREVRNKLTTGRKNR